MDEAPYRERRFRSDEVRKLIRRAATLEERSPGGALAGMDLTEEEMAEHARALGISPEAMRAAAQDTELEPDREVRAPRKGPMVIELTLDGTATNEAIAAAIAEEAGELGTVEQRDGVMMWRGRASDRRSKPTLSITVRRAGGLTHARLEQQLWPAKVIGWVAMAMPLALSGGINALLHPLLAGKVLLAVVLFSAVMVLAALLGVLGSSGLQRYAVNKVRRIAARLSRDFPALGAPVPSVRKRVEVSQGSAEPPNLEEQAAQDEEEESRAARSGGSVT